MEERVRHGLKEWLTTSEASLFQLRDLLRDATADELRDVPDLEPLLEVLVRRLIGAGRLADADDLVNAASTRWPIRLSGAVHRELAQAQRRAGDRAASEATIRGLVKRDPADGDALRLLYRLLRDGEQTVEAHDLLTRLVDLDPSSATATFAHRERAKLGETPGRPVRIALLSSYVVDPLVPFLDLECRRAGLAPTFYVGPFNQYTQEVLDPSSGLYQFAPDIIFVALDLEDLVPAVRGVPSADELAASRDELRSTISALVREAHARCNALIVVHELVLLGPGPHGILDNRRADGLARWSEDLNRDLAQDLAAQPSTFLLPLREVLARTGVDPRHSRKLRYMARMRYPDPVLAELARASVRYVKPLKGLTRKCVVLDLDGTLWGGVVGEVGPDGIDLGPTAPGVEYVDFQQALLNLTKRGILLAVCSKNNPDDVMPILREHKHMVLREEHFSALRINWRNKAENLAQIAEELNIGLDSLVFIDDNPVERELVRQMLPEVLTVELPRDASQYRSTLEDLTDFELLALTREDELRVSQYQANRRRQALERSSGSLDDYLRSLEIRVDIAPATAHHVPRLVQMFNKTNQFNATTRRYQAPDVERFLAAPDRQVWVLEVADRFGDHGLVGTAVVREERDGWCVDSFLLSCRVMGLSVETVLLKRILDAAHRGGVPRLAGEFVSTAKNGPTADLYRRHGFRLDGDAGGTQTWVLDPRVATLEDPAWIAVTVSGGGPA
jgi:FkbH-like protein